ncbi:MAG TPA: CHAT domain-containing tetratricopeptide repeat protein [Pseudonocardiaceae bacterium]|nr:CHAT domain-containing tetratricopeptide repeat protein [Pseudonocardiaceae bacterium]
MLKQRQALRLLGEDDDPETAELRIRILISLAFSDAEERSFEDGVEHLYTAGKYLADVTDARIRAELEATIEAQQGLMLMRAGRLDESIAMLGRAVAVSDRNWAQGIEDHFALGSNLVNRGLAHAASGRPGKAERDMRRAIEVVDAGLRDGSPDRTRLMLLAASAHHNLGAAARRAGDIPGALRHYRELGRRFPELPQSILPKFRMDHAEALLAGGLAQEAANHLDEALPEMRRQHANQNLSEAELLRAAAALIDGDQVMARKMASSARRRFLRRGSPAWAAIASLTRLRSEVVTALEKGRVPAALPAKALALADELSGLKLADEAAVARMLAVRLELRRGNTNRAAELLALVPTPRRVTPVDHRMLLRLCRAELAVATGHRRPAFAQARGGLTELGRLRDRMGGLELVSGTAVHGQELGELAVRLVLDQPSANARQLFDWVERTRAQVYRYEPLPAMADTDLVDRLQEYRTVSRQVQHARVAGRPVGELIAKLTALQREVMRLGWGESPWGRPRPIATLAEVLERIEDRALVSYVVSGQGIAAVVVADGRARLVRLGAAPDAAETARELRADLDVLSPDHLAPPIAAAVSNSARIRATRLDDQLLRPVASIIGDRELVVVPTGDLYAVAWGTLPSLRGRPVSVAPSATAWLTAMREETPAAQGGTVLAAGPDLQAAVGEVSSLRANYPNATVLDGPRAGVRSVLAALDGARLAHLAAHGTHEPENSLFSRLELADGALYAHEMSRLRRPPAHVVLAACELGVSRIRPGDEALGFAGALLAIGCKAVIAPVTRVGDLAAAAAMADYHRRLSSGAQPAVALAETTAIDPLRRPFISLGASQFVAPLR